MLRILIVDDDRGTRDTYGLALGREGYDVELADSPATAIQVLSLPEPLHALFLDLNLGDRTGFDVLRWMRAQSRFVPTAVMTAFRGDFNPDEAIELGALAYVDQPLWLETLIALARSLTRPPSALDDSDQLHARVIAGDPGALECVCAIFLRQPPRRLERAFPRASFDLAEDAVSRACLEYAAGAARRFDAESGRSVLTFAYRLAWRNLRDVLQSESSLAGRHRRAARDAPDAVEPDFELLAPTFDLGLAILVVTQDPAERRAADAWMDGGNSDAIALALGCGHLNLTDRRRAAKQFKDRMIKRLSRYVREQNFAHG